ncbi:MAG TPA: hypothetical protein VD971_12755 [Phycisphaerales bacterium]|nr:hypothetical protein [Phycisphaerales bacterium]
MSDESVRLQYIEADIKPHEVAQKARVIAQILAYNASASPDFLSRFTLGQLQSYLDHLTLASGPRGNSPWIRRGDVPAVAAYRTTA